MSLVFGMMTNCWLRTVGLSPRGYHFWHQLGSEVKMLTNFILERELQFKKEKRRTCWLLKLSSTNSNLHQLHKPIKLDYILNYFAKCDHIAFGRLLWMQEPHLASSSAAVTSTMPCANSKAITGQPNLSHQVLISLTLSVNELSLV